MGTETTILPLAGRPAEPPDDTLPVTESPAYWFLLMEDAKGRGDFEAAARAKRELQRLGVTVTYRPRRLTTRGGS